MGTKIKREFKKNRIVLTAVVVDFDLDTKLYALKWEEEKADTEKEHDYTGQKIGMYLHSDELEKFEICECIRKKFDGMAYDGEIVSINLDITFYHIRYTDKDEEVMTVSDIQRFWIAKEVKKRGNKNNKQCRDKNEWLQYIESRPPKEKINKEIEQSYICLYFYSRML